MTTVRKATLSLEVDSLKALVELTKFNRAVDQTAAGTRKASSIVGDLTRTMIGLGAVYASWRGLSQLVQTSVRDFAEFERQIANVSTQLDEATMGYLPGYARGIRQLSIEMGENTTTLSTGLYDILSAAIPAGDAMKLLEVSARGAQAGLTTTAITTDAMTSVLNAYGLSVEYADKISSDFFESVLRGKQTFPQLAQNIGHVASIAAITGLSLEELLAAIATLTRSGIQTDWAVIGIKNALSEFLKPADESKEAARALGIELNTTTLRSLQLSGVLKLLKEQSPETVAAIFREARGLNAITSMLNQYEGFLYDVNFIQRKSNSDMEAYGKMADTTAKKFERFREAMRALRTTLGEVLAPAIVDVTERITKWVQQDPERFRYYGLIVQNELSRMKDGFLAFTDYLKNDFTGASQVAFDLFLSGMEMAARAAIDLAIRTGKGLWAAIKNGELWSGDDVRSEALKRYMDAGYPTFERTGRRLPTSSQSGQYTETVPVDVTRMRELEAQVRAERLARASDHAFEGWRDQWDKWSKALQTDIENSVARAARGSDAGLESGRELNDINTRYDRRRDEIDTQFAKDQLQGQLANILLWPGQQMVKAMDWMRQWQIESQPTMPKGGGFKPQGVTAEQIRQYRESPEYQLQQSIDRTIRQLEIERRTLAMSNDERERTLIIFQAEEEARENGLQLSQAQVDVLDKEIDRLQRMRKIADVGRAIGEGFAQGFQKAILWARNTEERLDALRNAAIDVLDEMWRIMITRPLAESLSGFFTGFIGDLFTGGAGIGSVSPVGDINPGMAFVARTGRVLDRGRVLAFAGGGVIDRPTMFPLMQGMGLAGEAGPEAIVPLKRRSDGRLGVSSAPSAVNVEVPFEVQIINQTGKQIEAQGKPMRDGRRWLLTLVAKDIQDGGVVAQAMDSRLAYAR